MYIFQFKGSVQVKLCIKKNKDVGKGLDDFLSLGRHLPVPFLFYEVTSPHSLHFIEMIFPLV